jgi:hypothetical protein
LWLRGSISVSCTGAICFAVHLHGVRGFSRTPGYGQSLAALQRNSQRLDAFHRSAAVGIKCAPGDAIPANGMVFAFTFSLALRRDQGCQPDRNTCIGCCHGADRLNRSALTMGAWPPPGRSPSLCGDYLSRSCSGHPPRTLPVFVVSQELFLHVSIPPPGITPCLAPNDVSDGLVHVEPSNPQLLSDRRRMRERLHGAALIELWVQLKEQRRCSRHHG